MTIKFVILSNNNDKLNLFSYDVDKLSDYVTGKIQNISDAEYELLLGHPIPDSKWSGEIGLNDALCQLYYAKGFWGRFIYKRLDNAHRKKEAQGVPDLDTLFIFNMPFRAMSKLLGTAISLEMTQGMVDVVNGHFFAGMGTVIRGYFKNKKENQLYRKLLDETK